MTKKKENTFIEITNKDIYNKLETISSDVAGIKEHLKTLNGSVKTNKENISRISGANKWVAGILFTLIVTVLGFLFSHINGG